MQEVFDAQLSVGDLEGAGYTATFMKDLPGDLYKSALDIIARRRASTLIPERVRERQPILPSQEPEAARNSQSDNFSARYALAMNLITSVDEEITWRQAFALFELTIALVPYGLEQQLLANTDAAITRMRNLRDNRRRVQAIGQIAMLQSQFGQVTEALELINQIEDRDQSSSILREMVEAHLARHDVHGAMRVKENMPEGREKTKASRQIIKALLKGQEFENALTLSAIIRDESERFAAL